MANPDLLILSILRALVEVALLALLGQGAVGLLAGAKRHGNAVYQLFEIITKPVIRVVRFITPKPVMDKHLPYVAFFVLFWFWIFLAWAKRFLAF